MDVLHGQNKYSIPLVPGKSFVPSVFHVDEPNCPHCRAKLDFEIYENFNGSEMDWLQWRCHDSCGYYHNVEIL